MCDMITLFKRFIAPHRATSGVLAAHEIALAETAKKLPRVPKTVSRWSIEQRKRNCVESCRAGWWVPSRQAVRRIAGRVRFSGASHGVCCRCFYKRALLLRRLSDLCIGCVAEEAVVTVVLRRWIRVRAVVAGGRSILVPPTRRVGAIAVFRDGPLKGMMEHMPTR